MFSKNWEKVYKKKQQVSVWPWTDLITLISRYILRKRKINNVLELGTGAGANIRFFSEKNINYYGVEGSKSAVNSIKKKFPYLKKKILVGDFTKKIPFKKKFDLIIDRGSITHNDHITIKETMSEIKAKLKNGGYLVCVDWFSKQDSAWKTTPKKFKKLHTILNIKKGDLKEVGTTHFASVSILEEIFKGWKLIHFEEKIKKIRYPNNNEQRAIFSFVLKKK